MNKIGRQGRQRDNRLGGVSLLAQKPNTKNSDFYTSNVLGHWNFPKSVPGVLRTDVEFLPWWEPRQIPTPAPACRTYSLLLDGPFKTYRRSTPAQTAPDRPCVFSCSFEPVPCTPCSWSDSFRARDLCGEWVSFFFKYSFLFLSRFLQSAGPMRGVSEFFLFCYIHFYSCPDFFRARARARAHTHTHTQAHTSTHAHTCIFLYPGVSMRC
jgi:hypothetical protein